MRATIFFTMIVAMSWYQGISDSKFEFDDFTLHFIAFMLFAFLVMDIFELLKGK